MGGGALAAVPQTGGLCRCLLLLSIYRVKVIALETPDLLTVRDEGRLVRICTEKTPVSRQRDGGEKSAWTQRQWFHTGLVYSGLGLEKQMDPALTLLVAGQEVGWGGGWGLLTLTLLWLAGPGSRELPSSLFLSTLGQPSLFASSSSCPTQPELLGGRPWWCPIT